MKDRVSWRRAWSLFYKVMIMQIIFTLMIWGGITYYGYQALNSLETAFDDTEDEYSKFDECFTEKLLNNEDVSKCNKYSPD